MNRISPCLPMKLLRLYVPACICFVLLIGETKAQTACFTMEDLGGQPISSGCIPNMVIRFLDCSQGVPYSNDSIGNYNSHHWNFRYNNNTSNAQSPVFGYFASGIYTITLTVRAPNGNIDSVSHNITVYESPVVDMVATPSEGCQPLNVCFTNTSTSTSSPIASCFWDFGGGDYDVNCNPCRTYNMRGTQNCFPVTLLVKNQLGCETVKTFPNAVCVDPPPTASFTSTNNRLCSPPFTITFTSTSQSVNPPLHLKWYFGDNDSAVGPNPTHTYTSVGVYDVKLVATDTFCNISSTVTMPGYVIAREVQAGFANTKTVFCQGENNVFLDTSIINPPGTALSIWTIGNQTYTGSPLSVSPGPGTYDVSLQVSVGGCTDTEAKTSVFTVHPKPDALFTAPNASSCQAPFTVDFNVTTPCSTCTYTWLFQTTPPITGTGLNPSHTYNDPGVYSVTLEVTDTITGCSATHVLGSAVRIEDREFDFEMDDNKGCIPHIVQFTDKSVVPPPNPPAQPDTITSRLWDFGIPGAPTSQLKNPTFTYTQAGKYIVTMSATTASGCSGSVTDTVYVGAPLTPDFEINPNPACVNEPVFFTNLTDTTGFYVPPGDSIRWYWDLPGVNNLFEPPQKIYEEPDTFFVKLAAGVMGCMDTIEKPFIVLYPKAEFLFDQDCSNPAIVYFEDTSKGADSWYWDFGDGSPAVLNDTNPVHTYTGCDTFEVLLVVENFLTGCTDSFKQKVYACALNADFDVDSTEACIGEVLNFTDRSVGLLQPVWQWDFNGEGTSGQENPSFAFPTPGRKEIELIIGPDAVGCYDTLVRTALINVTGVQAAFDATPLTGCIPPTALPTSNGANTVTFTNTSTFRGTPVETLRYQWSFGDTPPTTSTLQNPTHTYTAAGNYTVSLTTTADNTGCTSTLTKTINMRKPEACFTTAGAVFCSGQTVNVTNCTQGGGTFTWVFCDTCTPVVGVNPSHVYTLAPNVFRDTFIINMSVVDANGCYDDADPVSVIVTQPDLHFLADKDSSYCPPHVACFTDSSSLDTIQVTSVYWDFGDGDFSTLQHPCHIYTRPGQYNVTLTVQFQNQCISSITENTFIKVGGATGNLTITPDTGCVPMPVVLNAHPQGWSSIFWYFPWEDCATGIQTGRLGNDTVHSVICDPGTYQPFIYITDTQTPYPCTYILYSDTIVAADSLTAGFMATGPVCVDDPIQFTDTSFTELGDSIVDWLWDFGGGVTSIEQNPVHAFRTSGVHMVSLTVTSKIGCSATVTNPVTVLGKPTADFTVSDASGCDTLFVVFTDRSTQGPVPIRDWYYDFGDTTTSADTSPDQVATYRYVRAGAYSPYLVVTDNNGCDDTVVVPINVYKTPDGILLPSTVNICEGDSIQLRTDTFTYDSYSWTPATFISDPFAQHPYVFPRVSTTYTVSITEGHGCDMTDTVRVNVKPLPPLMVTPHPSVSICSGDTVWFNATGALSYYWTPDAYLKPSRTVPNPYVFPPVTIDYVVRGAGASGCIAKDTVRVIVSSPTAQFAGERNCLGDSTNYINQSTGTVTPLVEIPLSEYHWSFGNTGGTSTQLHPTYTFNVADTHLVQLVVIDTSGCTDTIVGTTIIDSPPDAAAEQDTFICLGDSVDLFASGGSSFLWTSEPQISSQRMINRTSTNPTVFPLENTVYIVNVRNGVCPSDTAQVRVDVIMPPVVNIMIPDSYVPRGQTIELKTEVDKTVTIEWSPDDSLSCSDCISPIARPYIKTTYIITVTDSFGCTDSDTVVVDADVECRDDQVFIANGFTPNDDGLNDKLMLRTTGIEKINFYRVFDRWGKEVFETKDLNEGWDGKNKAGGQLSGGVYVYVVEAVCFYGRTIVKTGNVTLIK